MNKNARSMRPGVDVLAGQHLEEAQRTTGILPPDDDPLPGRRPYLLMMWPFV